MFFNSSVCVRRLRSICVPIQLLVWPCELGKMSVFCTVKAESRECSKENTCRQQGMPVGMSWKFQTDFPQDTVL